ncbi:uncharacterized protein [Montipora capricornis]|uniref:uncharacterized protein isoform X3 n=1 Tax=Montipora capricornis TaxID=246305 RepID=UPI0035F20034
MKISSLRNAIRNVFFKEVDAQCAMLCARKSSEPSVLRVPSERHKNLVEFRCNNILTEMRERAPDVLDFMATVAVPKLKGNDGRQVMPLCTAYGILMNVKCRELSLVQKINAVLLGVGGATKRTFERLNKSGITQSRESFRNIMDDLGSNLSSIIKAKVDSGQELRVVFDNFDFRILANIILRNHRNSDMHWIAQYVTFDRVPSSHLDDSKPIVPDIKDFDNVNYLMSKTELDQQRNDYIILVARVLIEFFPALEPLCDAVPPHIPHRYLNEMAQKSCIVGLPVVPFNQNKVSDVCQYLQWLEDLLLKVFKKEDELPVSDASVLEKVRVPLAGDLLGRERVTGAKKTRLGCDSASERFENIVECPALWHAKQSFLSYVWEQLYSGTTIGGRDVGTLYHLRQHFRLVNVSNKVTKNYKSAESLMLSATKAYLCTAFKTWAGLDTLNGIPVNLPKLPTSMDTIELKKEFLAKHIGKFVDEFILVEFDVERAWMEAREEVDSGQHRSYPHHSSGNQRASSPGGGAYSSGSSHLSSTDTQNTDVLTSQTQCQSLHVVRTHVGASVQPHPGVGTQPATVCTHVGVPVQPHPGVGTQPATVRTHVGASVQPHPGVGTQPATVRTHVGASVQPHPGVGTQPATVCTHVGVPVQPHPGVGTQPATVRTHVGASVQPHPGVGTQPATVRTHVGVPVQPHPGVGTQPATVRTHVGASVQPHPGVGTQPATVRTHVGVPVQPHPGVGTQPATVCTHVGVPVQPHPGVGTQPATVRTHVEAPVQPHPGEGTQPKTGSTTAAST